MHFLILSFIYEVSGSLHILKELLVGYKSLGKISANDLIGQSVSNDGYLIMLREIISQLHRKWLEASAVLQQDGLSAHFALRGRDV